MNILVTISTILLILALSTQSILSKRIDVEKIQISHSGNMQAQRKAYNLCEKNLYKSKKGKKSESYKKSNTTIDSKTKKTIHVKDKVEIHGCSQLNIYPLFLEENKNTYELLARLIKHVYKDTSTFKNTNEKNLEYKLIDQIILAGKNLIKNKQEVELPKLKLQNEKYQQLYYRMLKGTKFYDPNKNIGIPSLLDVITINSSTSNRICLQHASYDMLSSLFNKKIAEKIIKSRLENNKITKEDFNKILEQENIATQRDFNPLEFISFTHKRDSYVTVLGIDEKTQITIRKTKKI